MNAVTRMKGHLRGGLVHTVRDSGPRWVRQRRGKTG
jgi:hypothetical protein